MRGQWSRTTMKFFVNRLRPLLISGTATINHITVKLIAILNFAAIIDFAALFNLTATLNYAGTVTFIFNDYYQLAVTIN